MLCRKSSLAVLGQKDLSQSQIIHRGDVYFGSGGYKFFRESDGSKLMFTPIHNYQEMGKTIMLSVRLRKGEKVDDIPLEELWTFEKLSSWYKLNQ